MIVMPFEPFGCRIRSLGDPVRGSNRTCERQDGYSVFMPECWGIKKPRIDSLNCHVLTPVKHCHLNSSMRPNERMVMTHQYH